MRYLKKFLLVGFITSCLILSFTLSASAFTLEDSYNYSFGDSWQGMFHIPSVGQRIIQVFYLTPSGVPEYVECLYTFKDNSGSPVLSDSVHYAYKNTNEYWLTVYWGSAGQFNNSSLSVVQYRYDKNGNLLATRSDTSYNNYPSSSTTIPCAIIPYLSPYAVFSGSQYAVPWGSGFLTGGISVSNSGSSSVSFVANNTLGFNFTINNADPVPPGGDDDSGGEGGSSCCCSSYEDYLIDIITNQESQLTKLNQIITILQNFNNQDVVDAVNDAVDDINDNLNNRTRTVPDSYDSSAIDDYNDEQSAVDDSISSFKGQHDFSDIFDDFDVTEFNDGMSFWEELFDDVVGSNSLFLVVIVSMLTLGIIVVILNRRVGKG